jgi:predicted nucleic acid-binding Zn ribbon protein
MSRGRRRSRPEPVGRVLDTVLKDLGLGDRLAGRRVLEAWPRIVGELAASHSRAVDLRDGELTLQADHPVWRQELSLLSEQIVARCNDLFGEGTVRRIRWDRGRPRL